MGQISAPWFLRLTWALWINLPFIKVLPYTSSVWDTSKRLCIHVLATFQYVL